MKLHSLEFPAVSVAVHLTHVPPAGKKLPLGGSHMTVTGPPHESFAVTSKYALVPFGAQYFQMLPGHAICGGVTSNTWTVVVQLASR